MKFGEHLKYILQVILEIGCFTGTGAILVALAYIFAPIWENIGTLSSFIFKTGYLILCIGILSKSASISWFGDWFAKEKKK